MRTLNLSLFVVGILFLQSCSKDSDPPAANITYDGRSAAFNAGYRNLNPTPFDAPNGSTYYFHVLNLTSKGITRKNGDFTGKGDSFGLVLITETEEITAGTYTHSDENLPFVIDAAFLYFDLVAGTSQVNVVTVESGTVEVIPDGENHTLKFALVSDGKPITGEWTGHLTKIQY